MYLSKRVVFAVFEVYFRDYKQAFMTSCKNLDLDNSIKPLSARGPNAGVNMTDNSCMV